MNATSLINSALRLSGVIAQGETTPIAAATIGLEALNMMLGAWFSNGASVPYTVTESFTLTVSTNSYTIGSGADLDTTYPEAIDSAFIRYNDIDYPLGIINQREYWEKISYKTAESIPSFLFYDALNTTGKVYLYTTPDKAYTLYLISRKNLSEITDPALTIAIPRVYEEAIKFNLALRIAPEYGSDLSDDVKILARSSYKEMMRSNLLKSPVGVVITNSAQNTYSKTQSILTGD